MLKVPKYKGFAKYGAIIAFVIGCQFFLVLQVLECLSICLARLLESFVTSCRIGEISAFGLSLECRSPSRSLLHAA